MPLHYRTRGHAMAGEKSKVERKRRKSVKRRKQNAPLRTMRNELRSKELSSGVLRRLLELAIWQRYHIRQARRVTIMDPNIPCDPSFQVRRNTIYTRKITARRINWKTAQTKQERTVFETRHTLKESCAANRLESRREKY